MIQFLLLAGVVLAGAAGDVSISRAMKGVGEICDFRPAGLASAGWRTAMSGYLWIGIFWKAAAFFSFIALLTLAPLSWAVPASAVSFVIETVAAKYFLGERISFVRWAGALCICLGVGLLSL
jgi:drug/metabolite transporter (DMT)-like permease